MLEHNLLSKITLVILPFLLPLLISLFLPFLQLTLTIQSLIIAIFIIILNRKCPPPKQSYFYWNRFWPQKFTISFLFIITKILFNIVFFMQNFQVVGFNFHKIMTSIRPQIDLLIGAVFNPVLLDVYYGLHASRLMGLKHYNTYFVLVYRLSFLLLCIAPLLKTYSAFGFLAVELIWTFFTSHVGKFGLLNSTFLFSAHTLSNHLFYYFIAKGVLKLSNNFQYNF